MPLSLSFGSLEALGLLVLLPLVIWTAWQGKYIRRSTRRLSVALRLCIVTLLILSLAGLQVNTASDKLASIFLLDVSDSMGATGKQQALEFTRQSLSGLKDDQEAGVIMFGQDALVGKPLSRDKNLGLPDQSLLNSTHTNLAEAIRLGTALLPGDTQRRLVLLSDGNQNLDDVRNAARIAAAQGVHIDVVMPEQVNTPEVALSNLQLPATLRQGEEFSLKVAVDSNYAGPARLMIWRDGELISEKPVELQNGSNLFTEQLVAKNKGTSNFKARVVPAGGKDTLEQNNETQAFALVKTGPRALLVEGHPEQHEAANLQAALSQSEIEATVIPPENFPPSTELAKYDSVVLVNVPATSLNNDSQKTLQSYVKDLGKGLVVVGGEESYGLGGYFRTPLEEMLPMELQLPSKLKMPSVAMVLVIDRSASMLDSITRWGRGGSRTPKLELAKDAAYLAVTQLSNTDQIGVVVFDTRGQWHVPLGPVGDTKKQGEAISRIAPGGGTQISTGLAPAIEALKNATATNKHIILLTDGQDGSSANYDVLVKSANEANITLSTVGLGEDVNSNFLRNLAERGGGRYHFINDQNNLPKIFAKEARLAARSYIVEEPFVPAIGDASPIIKRIPAAPELRGYVATVRKPNTTVALVTGRNEPLLAHWQYGLGRVAAWTSDAKGRWATNWLSWPDFPRFWSQMVRWTVAENEAGGLQVQTRLVGNRIYVVADALSKDSQYLNGLAVRAKVASTQDGKQEEIALTQTAPGHYEGFFVPKNTGTYSVNVQGNGEVGALSVGTPQNTAGGTEKVTLEQTIGAVAGYSPEYKQLGVNDLLLKDIVRLTGGRMLTDPGQVFERGLSTATRQHDLWPWLLLAAILLFPLDIAVRRIRLSPLALLKGFRDDRRLKRRQAQAMQYAPRAAGLTPVAVPVGTMPEESPSIPDFVLAGDAAQIRNERASVQTVSPAPDGPELARGDDPASPPSSLAEPIPEEVARNYSEPDGAV